MTGASRSYHDTLSHEEGEKVNVGLTKTEASKKLRSSWKKRVRQKLKITSGRPIACLPDDLNFIFLPVSAFAFLYPG